MSNRKNGSALSDRPPRPSYDQRGVFPSHNHLYIQIMQVICTNSLRVATHGLKESSLQAPHPSADVQSVYSTTPGESTFHMPCTFMMIMDLRNFLPLQYLGIVVILLFHRISILLTFTDACSLLLCSSWYSQRDSGEQLSFWFDSTNLISDESHRRVRREYPQRESKLFKCLNNTWVDLLIFFFKS